VGRKADRDQILKDAWIGDAVLSLYVRCKILREEGKTDGPKANRMTSNQFLSVVAEPSETEAQIGRIFARDGLDAAYHWIEERLVPIFEKQEANRRKLKRASPKRRPFL
jgi:23S rRNA maturation mini-RNase III